MNKFKIGDRVRYVYHRWCDQGLVGREGVVERTWTDEGRELCTVLLDGETQPHSWFNHRLEPVDLSPFEQSIRDYIKSELSHA